MLGKSRIQVKVNKVFDQIAMMTLNANETTRIVTAATVIVLVNWNLFALYMLNQNMNPDMMIARNRSPIPELD